MRAFDEEQFDFNEHNMRTCCNDRRIKSVQSANEIEIDFSR